MTWLIHTPDGSTFPAAPGQLEVILTALRGAGHDEFIVNGPTETPGSYVPELERPDVPDTLPEDWT